MVLFASNCLKAFVQQNFVLKKKTFNTLAVMEKLYAKH